MANGQVTTGVNVDGGVGEPEGLDLTNIIPQILARFVAVLEGAAIIAIGFFLIRYLRTRFRKIEATHEQQRNAINLLEKITSGFIVVISITLALKIIGLDMTLLVSVAILGLSYGLQDIIKNYVAGILILFKAPFKIGDVVKIRDFTGRVNKMDFQSTTLETFDNRHITIYNSDVMTQSIVNYSNNTIRRLDFDVTVGYSSDIQAAIKIFEQILNSNEAILKNPKYSISFKKFTDSGATFMLRFWVQRPCNILKVKTGIATQISQAFDEQKICMPYVKGVETEDEGQLSKTTDERRGRIQSFYQQPLFAQAFVQEQPVQVDVNGQPVPQAVPAEYDAEEPE